MATSNEQHQDPNDIQLNSTMKAVVNQQTTEERSQIAEDLMKKLEDKEQQIQQLNEFVENLRRDITSHRESQSEKTKASWQRSRSYEPTLREADSKAKSVD